MITRRGLLLLFFAAIAYLLAAVTDVPAYLHLAGVISALLFSCFLLLWISAFGVNATLNCDRQAVIGDSAFVRVDLHNRWPVPRFNLAFHFNFPPLDAQPMVCGWVSSMRPLAKVSVELHPVCKLRGKFEVDRLSLLYHDPLGLFYRSCRFKHAVAIEVLPKCATLRQFPFIEAGSGFRDQQNTVATPGFSSDFFALRRYMSGDSPRWIHWLSSLRMQELMTRQFQAPVQRQLLVVLDCVNPFFGLVKRSEAFETAVNAAASIVRFAAETDHETGFLAFGRSSGPIRSASGMETVRQIVAALALVQLDGSLPPAGAQPIARTGVRSLIIITAHPGDAFQKMIRALRNSGLSVSVVFTNSNGKMSRRVRDGVNFMTACSIPFCVVGSSATVKRDLEMPFSGLLADRNPGITGHAR